MRSNGFITVVIPFEGESKEVDALLKSLTPSSAGNQPNRSVSDRLRVPGLIHFLSMAVVDARSPMDDETPITRGNMSHLMIEVSSDTGVTETLTVIAEAIGPTLARVFDCANLAWRKDRANSIGRRDPEPDHVMLARFLVDHHVEIGDEWGMALGQVHDGSPGMTVRRILDEAQLAKEVSKWIETKREHRAKDWLYASPMQRLEQVRDWLWDTNSGDAATPAPKKWAFAAEPSTLLAAAPDGAHQEIRAALSIGHKLLWPLLVVLTLLLLEQYFLARTDLWPLVDWKKLLLLEQYFLAHIDLTGPPGDWNWVKPALGMALVIALWWARPPRRYPILALVATTFAVVTLLHSFGDALRWFFLSSVAIAAATAIAVLAARRRLQRLEQIDPVNDHAPTRRQVTDYMKEENYAPQNHMFTISTIKPGLTRMLALRVILTIVGANLFVSRPGFLGKNGVIHSARWLWIRDPKLRFRRLYDPGRLIFWSNYDGTWESYVGDFVADAPDNVTGLWSNCVGFPRAKNLIDDGAKNRDRLVRWARRQQKATHWWYSAYPELTTERIRINAAIRQGIASAQSDADARDWLSLFSSKPRPAGSLATNQIPTLVFGGLAKLGSATCYMVRMCEDAKVRRSWIAEISKEVTFGELLPGQTRAVALAFSVDGLQGLGLPVSAIDTFPVPFQQGMWTKERARALGDKDESDPSNWDWGSKRKHEHGDAIDDRTIDVFVVIYGMADSDVEHEYKLLFESEAGRQQTVLSRRLARPKENDGAAKSRYRTEHFGFADGVSQPAIVGLRRSAQHAAHNDRVGPGEIVLGYPDSLKRIPPSPSIDAKCDPDHMLADEGTDPSRMRPEFSRYEGNGRRDLGANGTFLVVRQLQQHVDEWEPWLVKQADRISREFVVSTGEKGAAIVWGDPSEVVDATKQSPSKAPVQKTLYTESYNRQYLEHAIAAKLIGRWRDGSPLVRHPMVPGGEEASLDNNFKFGVEDPQGLACPLGAHIRRANPRDTRIPGLQEEIDSVNRHRILRVGRAYGERTKDADLGLMFMCLNADIERQYEFVQKSWILNDNMNGLDNEGDPLTGQGSTFSIPTPRGVVKLTEIPHLVTVRGGGYFFMPGQNTLKFLAHVGEKSEGTPFEEARPMADFRPMPALTPSRPPSMSEATVQRELEIAPAEIAKANDPA